MSRICSQREVFRISILQFYQFLPGLLQALSSSLTSAFPWRYKSSSLAMGSSPSYPDIPSLFDRQQKDAKLGAPVTSDCRAHGVPR